MFGHNFTVESSTYSEVAQLSLGSRQRGTMPFRTDTCIYCGRYNLW